MFNTTGITSGCTRLWRWLFLFVVWMFGDTPVSDELESHTSFYSLILLGAESKNLLLWKTKKNFAFVQVIFIVC